MALSSMTLSTMTLNAMTLSTMILGTMTLGTMTLSIMTLSTMTFITTTLSKAINQMPTLSYSVRYDISSTTNLSTTTKSQSFVIALNIEYRYAQ